MLLPPDYPTYSETVCQKQPTSSSAGARCGKSIVRQCEGFSRRTRPGLIKELINLPDAKGKPVGIILMPQQSICKECGASLLLRSDRSSQLILYTEKFGMVPAVHYHKYCKSWRAGCKLVQHYGYTTNGTGDLRYDDNWNTLPYFVSSQETAFELFMLEKYDIELLIGQVSYKQRADIYNYQHKYEDVKKRGAPVATTLRCMCVYNS